MQLFINNWRSQLASPLASTSLTMQVHPDDAALLVGLGSGDHYLLTLAGVDAVGVETAHEIVRVTGNAAGSLTIVRAQEGTAAAEWPISSRVECRFTAGAAMAPAAALAAHTAAADPHTQYQQKEAGKGLSTNDYTADEKNKLASLEGSHYKGLHSSLEALQAAKPSSAAGDYADVDAGAGSDVQRYLWDVSDAGWKRLGASTPMTATQIKVEYESNVDTNAFTDAEKAKLAALQPGGGGLQTGDVLFTLRNPGAGFVAPGSIQLQAAYPSLFALVGLTGGTPNGGATWDSVLVNAALDEAGWIETDGNGVWCITHYSGLIYRSTDDGLTWTQQVLAFGGEGYTPRRLFTDGSGVWIGTLDNGAGGQFRSTDNGATWDAAITSGPVLDWLAGDGSGVWVRGSGGGDNLQRSTDNGVTWANVAHNVPQSFWDVKCAATDGAGHWIACGSNGSGGNGFSVSADNGLTWTSVANPLAGNAVPLAIAYHDGVWVVGAEGGKLARSTDNGATWTHPTGPTISVKSIAANAGAWLATDDSLNLWRSTDAGQTWSSTSFSTQFGGVFIRNVAGSATTFIMAGTSSNVQRSASTFPYDPATEFQVPTVTAPAGTTAYFKAGS